MREGKLVKLSEVCRVYQPETIAKKSLPTDGTFPVYGANGRIGFNDKYNHEEPQLLLGCRGSVGSVHVSEPFSWINGNSMVVQPFDTIVTRDYLKYAFLGGISIKDAISGTAQPQITRESLAPIEIFIPPLNSQRETVTRLDKAFAEIDLLDNNIESGNEKANELLQSIQSEALTVSNENWESWKIGDLGKWVTGSTPSTAKKEFWGDEVPFVTPADLGTSGELGEIVRRISKLGSEQVRIIRAPAVVLVCIGATLGKVAWTNKKITTNQQINTLQVDVNKFNTKFLMYLLSSPHTQKKLWDSSTGTTVPILNKGNLENISIFLPSLERQCEIVEKLDFAFAEIEKIKNQIAIKKDFSGMLRQSLLSEAFSPTDEKVSA